MKIFTEAKTVDNTSFVGVVLTGEHNANYMMSDYDVIYMMKSYALSACSDADAHLFGIKKALSFIQSNKLKVISDKLTICNNQYANKELIEKLSNDVKVDEFRKIHQCKIELRKKETMFDNHMNIVAKQRIMYNDQLNCDRQRSE